MRPARHGERALTEVEKIKERLEALCIAEGLKWKDVDSNNEVFLMEELPAETACTALKARKGDVFKHTIYRTFLNDSIITRLGNDIDQDIFNSGSRKTRLVNGKIE